MVASVPVRLRRLLINEDEVKKKAGELFREVRQLGVGVRGGAEIAVQAVRTWLSKKDGEC